MNKYIISIFLLILVIIISQGTSYYLENNTQEGMMDIIPEYIQKYMTVIGKDTTAYLKAAGENKKYYTDYYYTEYAPFYNVPEYYRQLKRSRRRFFNFRWPGYPYFIPPHTNEKITELYNKAKRANQVQNDIRNAFNAANNSNMVVSDIEIMKNFLKDIQSIINGNYSYTYKMIYVCISIPNGFSKFMKDDDNLYENNDLQAHYPTLFVNDELKLSTYTQILQIFTTYKSIKHLFASEYDSIILPDSEYFYTQSNIYINGSNDSSIGLNNSINELLKIYQ